MKYLSKLFALALILASCATETSTTDSGDWVCSYCHNVEIHQTGTGFWFDFPNKDGVHYVVKNLSGVGRSNDRIADHGNVAPEQSPPHLSANQANVTRNGKNSQQATPAQIISVKGGDATWKELNFTKNPSSIAALTVQSSGAATITATFTITGAGKIVSEGGGTPQVRLYFQRKGDTMSGTGDYEYYRYWSNPNAVRLTPEILKLKTFKLTAKLVPGMWSSVYGKFGDENVKMFNAAVADMAVAGMTFGDDFGFGHGVHAASGKPRFTLTGFTVQ